MALMKCPECGVENVSDTASKCPHCGYNLSAARRRRKNTQRKQGFSNFVKNRTTKVVLSVWVVILIGFFAFSLHQKAQYRAFSGEYRGHTGLDGIPGIPNVIKFDEDGTGHYYENRHMYIFDYKLTSTTVEIDTHEEFMPIYTAELDVICKRNDSGFLLENIQFDKR